MSIERTLLSGSFFVALALAPSTVAIASDIDVPFSGAEAEAFLRQAEIVSSKPIGVGISGAEKVTLTDGIRTHHAVWKTVDVIHHGLSRGPRGGYQLSVRDSYQYEVAAYELDKFLGLGIVPPTVERDIGGRRGSLQLWIEGGFTELDRREGGREPPNESAWSNRLYQLRLFQQLIYDSDFKNIRNILYGPDFRVYSIDHSRAFRTYPVLLEEAHLLRFSRALLAKLDSLDRDELERVLGSWLTSVEIEGLLRRRDKILERAATLAERLGPEIVLYP